VTTDQDLGLGGVRYLGAGELELLQSASMYCTKISIIVMDLTKPG